MFGCCLVNDWSARAIQFFEMMLGPHLGKSFLTTDQPVDRDDGSAGAVPRRRARRARRRARARLSAAIPADRAAGAFDIELTADLALPGGQSQQIVRTNLRELFWTLAQMVAHQASGGAPLEARRSDRHRHGSGASDEARACLAEITRRGKTPIVFAGRHRSA